MQVGTLPHFLDQWKSMPSYRFVLNTVKGHHLQLRCHPPLVYNFKWFNSKVATAHHPVIQKDMEEILAKVVTEPSTVGDGFYSNVLWILHVLMVYDPYSVLSNTSSKCT